MVLRLSLMNFWVSIWTSGGFWGCLLFVVGETVERGWRVLVFTVKGVCMVVKVDEEERRLLNTAVLEAELEESDGVEVEEKRVLGAELEDTEGVEADEALVRSPIAEVVEANEEPMLRLVEDALVETPEV